MRLYRPFPAEEKNSRPDGGRKADAGDYYIQKGETMSRERQRENRRIKAFNKRIGFAEEKLDLVDSFGKKDPTPYQAVKNIIRREGRT